MARKARKIGVGDVVTLQARVTGVGVIDGYITVEINGQKQTIPEDLSEIIDVKPFNPADVYKRVR
ncbi:hypothetical protein C1M53_31650 [Mesorhizobium sp. Pch-S]|nr:hypothetical protein C1M53_31320 [Mesorhizobium sp. Pch-S]QAZ46809.1 hypothetical protein C1M53_31650 [Mesorhizobium sp. Pch-S]